MLLLTYRYVQDTEGCEGKVFSNEVTSLQNQAFLKTNTAIEPLLKPTDNANAITFNSTSRLETSSPYDNLFLNPPNDTQQSPLNNKYKKDNKNVKEMLVNRDNRSPKSRIYQQKNLTPSINVVSENLVNGKPYSTAFNKYGPIKETLKSQSQQKHNDEDYTSDDSVYQSEGNQSSCSMGSISPSGQNNMIRNGLPDKNGIRKPVRKIQRPKQEKPVEETKPHIGMAVRRSTASVMESRISPPLHSVPICNSICPIHDESDFIGNLRFLLLCIMYLFSI